ncbi:hypothetical protein MC885_001903, partial [Smutsia gigantea]
MQFQFLLSEGCISFLWSADPEVSGDTGKPLATTWDEAARLDAGESGRPGRLFPTARDTAVEKMDVIDTGASGL